MDWYYIIGLCALIQAVWLPTSNGFKGGYYHDRSKQEIKPPMIERNNSYFGYSMSYYSFMKNLVISAPRYDNFGKVYDCDFKNQSCVALKNTKTRGYLYQHDYWLGATVRAGPDYVVTCAPLRTVKFGGSIRGTAAACYKRTHNLTTLSEIYRINNSTMTSDLLDLTYLPELVMDSFGWSIDIHEQTIIIGGPALYTGRVIVYNSLKANPELLDRNRDRTKLPVLNMGYSVAIGNFLFKNNITFAVGSTFGQEGDGSVHLFDKNRTLIGELPKVKEDHVVGSMFGAAMCAAILSGGDVTDLLVGAPTYGSRYSVNMGAVYVYLTKGNGEYPKYHRTIKIEKEGSYFGSAIVSVGDLNGDKKDEIAIAAPYEDEGRGAVYLYSGEDIVGSGGVKWLQRIQHESYKGFGMSLAPLQDYDENGCNELAIGAPYNDRVMLYRCMAAITVTLKAYALLPIVTSQTVNGTQDRRLSFRVCLLIEYPVKPKEIEGDILTTVELSHKSAYIDDLVNNHTYSFNTSLARGSSSILYVDLGLILPSNGRYEDPLIFKISSKLISDPLLSDTFNEARVLLSDRSVLEITETVLAAECSGHNKVCVPNTTLNFNSRTMPFKIGSSLREDLELSVHNTGDVAYDPCVVLRVHGVAVNNPSSDCAPVTRQVAPDPDVDVLRCAPINPLKTNQSWFIGPIALSMSDLTNKNDSIQIEALMYNDCKLINVSKTYTHIIALKSDPDSITISAKSDIEDFTVMTRNELNEKVMKHEYTITKTTPTKWLSARCDIVMPKKPYIKYLSINMHTEYGLKLSDLSCVAGAENDAGLVTTCTIPVLSNTDSIKIQITMEVLIEDSDVIPESNTFALSTRAILYLDDAIKRESLDTSIIIKEAIIPLWIIIAAVLIGLLILIIIVFILYELGFLRRKKKQNLQDLQKAVKRQTIRRSMMQATQQQMQEGTSESCSAENLEIQSVDTESLNKDKDTTDQNSDENKKQK